MAILCTIKNNYGSGITDFCDIFGLKFETRILLGCFHTFPLIWVEEFYGTSRQYLEVDHH